MTGIYKAMPIRINPRQRVTRSIFKTYVDVLHVISMEKKVINGHSMGGLDGDAETNAVEWVSCGNRAL